MHSSFIDAIIKYVHGDGVTVLPQMELLLFALGILIFDFLLDKDEREDLTTEQRRNLRLMVAELKRL